MQMESRRADAGTYGTANTPFTWTAAGFSGNASANPAPGFQPGNSKMTYTLTVGATSLTYGLNVYDPSLGASVVVYTTNQNGSNVFTLK